MDADAKLKATQSSNFAETRICPTCHLTVSSSVTRCPNDGTSLLTETEVGDTFADQYEIVSVIATGGMGIVYEALHIALNQKVAIKMMQTERLDDARVKRFRKEAESLTALEHPNIIHVRDYGLTENGQPYMVLDFVQGMSLSEIIHKRGPLPVEFALDIFTQIASALAHAHERGVLHRDLKPGNIMICETPGQPPTAKLIDFGIAKDLNSGPERGLTATGEVLGSPAYMSPEQTSGSKIDQGTDIYSLGCVMFEALTGTPPFQGATAIDIIFQQINSEAPLLKERSRSGFPQGLEEVVAQALQKDPQKRQHSMTELYDQLTEVIVRQKKTNTTAAPGDLRNPNSSLAKALLACCAILVTIIVAMNTYLILQKQKQENESLQLRSAMDQATKDDIARNAKNASDLSANSIARELIRTGLAGGDREYPGRVRVRDQITDDALDEFSTGKADAQARNGKPIGWIVDIEESSVKGPGLAYLIRYPVEVLSLNDSSVTDRAFLEIVHMPLLRQLQLDGTEITNAGLKLLAKKKLHVITVRNDQIDDQGMKNISEMKTLEQILCGRNEHITDAGYAYLKKLPKLTNLDAQRNPMDLNRITVIAQLKTLTELNLSESNIDDEELKIISSLPNLRELSLWECKKITAAGLTSLSRLQNLQKLEISEIPWKAQDMDFVVSCPKLTDLDINDTDVTDELVDTIAKSKITVLHLSHTKLSDRGLMMLSKNKNLKYLEVGPGPITTKAIDEFEKLRPGVLHEKR
jgi:serine/threonine protein kinase